MESLKEHDMAETFETQKHTKETGKQFREHNFQLGYHNPYQNPQTEYSKFKVEDRSKSTVNAGGSLRGEIKRNHFELGNKRENNDYTSIAKLA